MQISFIDIFFHLVRVCLSHARVHAHFISPRLRSTRVAPQEKLDTIETTKERIFQNVARGRVHVKSNIRNKSLFTLRVYINE